MIDAKEAKALSEEGKKTDLTKFEEAIRTAARNGSESAQVQITQNMQKSVSYIIETLQGKGFKVKREQGYDQRDGGGWDYLNISW